MVGPSSCSNKTNARTFTRPPRGATHRTGRRRAHLPYPIALGRETLLPTQAHFDFDDSPLPPFAIELAPKLSALARQGVYFGTSSWKYEGWLGQIYTPDRYLTRNKFSLRKFEDECLREYAQTFPAVCGDFSFYQFPTEEYWARLFGGTPASLLFAFKVPESVTVPVWPKHARYGKRAGLENEEFLNPGVFRQFFADRLEPYHTRIGALIFEFGTFAKTTFPHVQAFLDRLGPFLAALPEGFRYSVEIRNSEYLGTSYFATLAEHNTAHVFNAWTRMPELSDQIDRPGAYTADFTVVRALLRNGRNYEQAVELFEPYEVTKEPNPAAREGLRRIVEGAIREKRFTFLFVNNRLEGNAPATIDAVASLFV